MDGGYVNVIATGLIDWAARQENIVAVPPTADGPGLPVLPRRWVVEPTVGWWGRCRRLARADERTTTHAEAMI